MECRGAKVNWGCSLGGAHSLGLRGVRHINQWLQHSRRGQVCSGALGTGGAKDLLQKVTSVRTKGEGRASQREEGRARVFMTHAGNCESFGKAGFRGHVRAARLER